MTPSPRLLERCLELVRAFPQQTVLGIGDVMLDQYRRGKATGLSPEAPAIDLLNPDLLETPGGAAVVAWNIGHVGGQVRMIGVVGKDEEAKRLRSLLEQTPGLSFLGMEDASRHTTLKLRFYHGPFQVLRVSQESKQPLDAAVARACADAVTKNLEGCRAVFIEDYGKQLITAAMVETLCALRRTHPALPIILDPKIGNHLVYRPGMCTLLKPNWEEACQLVGADPGDHDHLAVAQAVAARYETDVLMTLGAAGAFLFERTQNRGFRIPTRPREAFDVAGAGDTTLAVATLALAAGASLLEASVLANLAGGIVVEKSGTAYVTPQELSAEIQHPKTQGLLAALEPASVSAAAA